MRPGEPVTLNFANAEIEAVARTMATITGRNVVVDPRVRGQLNLVTERAVPPAAAFQQFLAALRLQGFTVVEAAGLAGGARGRRQAARWQRDRGPGGQRRPAGGQIVTQIFKLNHESANNLVPVLRPLISPNNTINANPGTNALVITDYADNLQRLGKIIAAMDVSNASDVEVISLKNAIATDPAPLVARLIDSGSTRRPGPRARAIPRSRPRCWPSRAAIHSSCGRPTRPAWRRCVPWCTKLDQPPPGAAAPPAATSTWST